MSFPLGDASTNKHSRTHLLSSPPQIPLAARYMLGAVAPGIVTSADLVGATPSRLDLCKKKCPTGVIRTASGPSAVA